VAKYPEFLPWCDRARVLEQDEAGMTAEVGIAFGGLRQSFTTRNTHVPGRKVHLKLVDGPFSNLDGLWKFTPVGEARASAPAGRTGPELRLQQLCAAGLVGPVFDKIASSLVEAFVKRAEQVYGDS
jgi:ribosome-associated toxin RatA of RatAB toxin-antitoxin module